VTVRPLIEVRLSDRRPLWCRRYVVVDTYEGLLLGKPSDEPPELTKLRLKSLQNEAARWFGGNWPHQIVTPMVHVPGTEYPPVRITAFFTSTPIRPDMDLSSMIISWFQREPWPIPDDETRRALEGIDWRSLAADYKT
jgi:hypothetical protein